MFSLFLVAWISLSIVVGVAADTNGEGISWVLVAIVIAPLIAGVLVLLLSRRNESRR